MAFAFTDQNVNELIASGQPVVIDFLGHMVRTLYAHVACD